MPGILPDVLHPFPCGLVGPDQEEVVAGQQEAEEAHPPVNQ